jgi:DnaK suppressor protein
MHFSAARTLRIVPALFTFSYLEGMTQDELDQIRERAKRKFDDLEERIAEYRELTKPIPPSEAIGRVSRMDAINNRSVNEAALRQLEEELSQLAKAVERMRDAKYGKCMRCGDDIPVGRLMLMPGASCCVRCA